METQSIFCLYLQNEFELFHQISQLWSSFIRSILTLLYLKFKTSVQAQTAFYKFLDMTWIWNLHWGCFLINEVSQWFYQLGHVNFSKTIFWSENFSLSFCQIYYAQMSTLWLACMLKFLRSWAHRKKSQEKSRDHMQMTSCDQIFEGVSLM